MQAFKSIKIYSSMYGEVFLFLYEILKQRILSFY